LTRWEAFNAVCGHLRAGLLGGPSFEWDTQAPWELLVECAGRHNVTPALAWCLMDDARLADDVRAYLAAVVTLSGKRNERLLDGLANVVGMLNAFDIEPVLLKGGAYLVEGIYPAAGLRVVSDIDLLVPEDRAKQAAAALDAIGFVVAPILLPANHLHLPLMWDETGLHVELHTRVEHDAALGIIPADWFCQSARQFNFRGLRVRLPDATRSIAHNIVHSQINHEFDRLNRVELRQLLDLAVIRSRQESAIDWAEIDHRFSAAGHADLLATYLKCAEVFFGQPLPKLSGLPRPLFLKSFRSSVERPKTKKPPRRAAPPRRLEQVRARLVDRHAGFVDQIVSNDETTVVKGWAVDFGAKTPARSVQIFVNSRHVAVSRPADERPDVAAGYEIGKISECGFNAVVRAPLGPRDVVQAFAELRGGVFAELQHAETATPASLS
jgi:hypothetical protein